jgi:hypothetical protein
VIGAAPPMPGKPRSSRSDARGSRAHPSRPEQYQVRARPRNLTECAPIGTWTMLCSIRFSNRWSTSPRNRRAADLERVAAVPCTRQTQRLPKAGSSARLVARHGQIHVAERNATPALERRADTAGPLLLWLAFGHRGYRNARCEQQPDARAPRYRFARNGTACRVRGIWRSPLASKVRPPDQGRAMPRTSTSDRLRRLARRMRAAHARDSQEWIRRMECSTDRGPHRPR